MTRINEPVRRRTVLIVDDKSFNISLLNATLKDEYKVMVALSGKEALNAVMISKPDLILLDVLMPDIDGYEVCTRLKKDEFTREIPVIFISSMDNDEDREKGLKLGAVGYIYKPFRSNVVLDCVREHIGPPRQTASS